MRTTKSIYFDQNNTPKLRLSYCVYMDILGFSEISSNAYKKRQGNVLLAKLHKIISSQAKDLIPDTETKRDLTPEYKAIIDRIHSMVNPNSKEPPSYEYPEYVLDWYGKLFTDNVVLAHAIGTSDGETEFGFVIFKTMLYQLELALEGFFVRGGIAIDDLFIDDNVVLGPALNKAYFIEQTVARDPRIVLSNDVFKLVKRHLNYYSHAQLSPQYHHVLVDGDGKPFLNYLDPLFYNELNDKDTWEYILKHKQYIEENLRKYRKNPIIWAKYQWLSTYHNFVCDEYKDFSGFQKKYLISEKLSNNQPSRIVKLKKNVTKRD